MKKEDRFETICKTLCSVLAVVLAWLHAPMIGVVVCILAGIFGSEVGLHDKYEDE